MQESFRKRAKIAAVIDDEIIGRFLDGWKLTPQKVTGIIAGVAGGVA